MSRKVLIAVAAAAGLGLLGRPALAQFPPVTDPNKDEQKCEKGTGSALVKLTGAKAKCVSKCIKAARKTMGPYTGCAGPGFTDPATNACIKDSVKGAEPKARAAIVKACTTDCPECYPASVCSTGDPFVTDTSNQLDLFGTIVYCAESGGGTPTKEEAKCEDGVSKALVKFVGAKSKCYTKCNDAILKGKIAPGSCDPPTPADAPTAACIFDSLKGAEAKAAAAIDKVCVVKPACYSGQTGAGWVALVEPPFDMQVPVTACGA